MMKIIKKNKTIIIVAIIVLALGIFILNQSISILYKADLIKNPCQLCEEAGNICKRKINIDMFPRLN